jgi:threonine/homoserine/homoserine lactone efflux protein
MPSIQLKVDHLVEVGQWLSLVSILLLGVMSPGPSVAVVISSTLKGGSRAGYLTACFHGIGITLYAVLTVAGLAVLLAGAPLAFLLMQIAGGLYLIWLGIKSLRSKGGSLAGDDSAQSNHNPALAGFLVAFLNPKVAIFMLALFSQFLDPNASVQAKGVMVASAGLIDAGWYAFVVAMISRPSFLQRMRDSSQLIDRVFGVILIVVALTVLLRAVIEFTA